MKKEKFIIKDILTNKKKLDRRYYLVQRFKQFVAALVLGAILGALFGCYLADGGSISIGSPKALEQPIEVKAVEITQTKIACDYDAITYIRCRGEQLGMSNQDITKMIRIARAESNFNQYAKNPNSTAKGIYQFIDSTWRSNCLKDGNVYDFKDNINCAWKVYQKQGDRPWNASKHIWSK